MHTGPNTGANNRLDYSTRLCCPTLSTYFARNGRQGALPENARGTVEVLDQESRFGHVGGCTEGKDPVPSALSY
jgi:hypothetical protein